MDNEDEKAWVWLIGESSMSLPVSTLRDIEQERIPTPARRAMGLRHRASLLSLARGRDSVGYR